MRPLVIAVAGHVDHGKTALTRALTGVDTDRLAEEKRRGLTIEVGFAPLSLPGGVEASLVDVPGHEKFLRNMAAGVAGVDAALLTVAADDGVMPQTREHLGILSLLGVDEGVVAITKADLAGPARLAQVSAQVAELVRGTFLEGAPVLPVSAATGAGLEALRTALAGLAAAPGPDPSLPFRMEVDRVFSVDGFGTVCTGTISAGALAEGDTVALYPAGREARVRRLERHGAAVPSLSAGHRAAVNLAGVERREVQKGDTLAAPGSLTVTERALASLALLPDSPYALKHSTQLHFHHGARALLCRCTLLGRETLRPGETGYARLTLSAPLAARAEDPFVVRFFSPATTVGGGRLLDLAPGGRSGPELTAALNVRAAGDREQAVEDALRRAGEPLSPDQLARRAGLPPEALPPILDALEAKGILVRLGEFALSPSEAEELRARCRGLLEDFHRRAPLLPGMALAQLRRELLPGLPAGAADALLALFAREHGLRLEGRTAALPGFTPHWTPALQAIRGRILEGYTADGLCPAPTEQVLRAFGREAPAARQVLKALTAEGLLLPLSGEYLVARGAFDAAVQKLRRAFPGGFTLAQARDTLGVSRRYALLLLECCDAAGLTRREGDRRQFLRTSR